MIDIKRTFYTWSDTQPVATGKTVNEEGQGLVAVMEGGVEKVMPYEANATGENRWFRNVSSVDFRNSRFG